MKKLLFMLAMLCSLDSLSAMVRAGVTVEPEPGYGYNQPYYYSDWYGPGYYYGVYFSDYPAYSSWRRGYGYYGGPYYYRYRHHHGRYHHRNR